MEQAAQSGRGPNKNAQPVIENHLASGGPGEYTTAAVAQATGLPRELVSTIMGRMARYGSEVARLGHQRSGRFYYQPQRRARVTALPSVGMAPPAPAPQPQPRHRRACPDSTLVHPSEHPQPSEDGSWVFFGETTGRPYRVVPL